MEIIKQNRYSLCLVAFKQTFKTAKDPSKVPEFVKNPDGTKHLRSSKDGELDSQIEPIAKEFCKPLKDEKNNKDFFILPEK